jgi:hypothetical protein
LTISLSSRLNFLSNSLREEGGFEYKKAIVDSIVTLISEIPDAKEIGLLHLCEFIEDCEFTYLSSQVTTIIMLFLLIKNCTLFSSYRKQYHLLF